jgi:Tfp pilus assembly protein PilF
MRLLITKGVLLIALLPVARLAAQATPLPAGTAEPQENAGAGNTPASRAQLLIAKAEDAIVRENYSGALPLLNSAIADAPANSPQMARAYYDRGYIEQEQQQASAAEADFRKANAADP